jgi:aspartate carbamoyltransferase catalytic subunit
MPNSSLKHILTVEQFSADFISTILNEAAAHQKNVQAKGGSKKLDSFVSTNLFYEPSTRTSSSFAAAMYRLGGQVIGINDVAYSSVAKGETLEDTIRTLEQYSDVIVLRHPDKGAAALAASVSSVPIINAGDGTGEHPTQALLDLYTIMQEQGKIDGLTITMVGDLKHGRTVHSLSKLLNHYKVTLQFVSTEDLSMPEDVCQKLTNPMTRFTDLTSALPTSDVVYMTRIQKERFKDLDEYHAHKDDYVLSENLMRLVKKTGTIMHPLPRLNEIEQEVDNDPRAAYFRQVQYGLYVRMALLAHVLNGGER